MSHFLVLYNVINVICRLGFLADDTDYLTSTQQDPPTLVRAQLFIVFSDLVYVLPYVNYFPYLTYFAFVS